MIFVFEKNVKEDLSKTNCFTNNFKKLFNVFISIVNKTKWKTNENACNYKGIKVTKKETIYIYSVITINKT